MNRRGFVFSTLVIFIVLIAFTLLTIKQQQITTPQGAYDYIGSANNFLLQLEKDLPRVLDVTAYRALIGMEEHISNTGKFSTNFSKEFSEALFNGTVNQTSYPILENSSLSEYLKRMQEISYDKGIALNISVANVSLSHESAFELRINTTLRVIASLLQSNTSWNYTSQISSTFSIRQIKDPLYTVYTQGKLPTPIRETNVTGAYITSENDTHNLQVDFNNSLYVTNPLAPSFLMRFVGNLSSSPYGISSLVDTKLLDSQGIVVHTDTTVVDFLYFNESNAVAYTVVNMPEEFLLDDQHLLLYDAVGKTT